VHSGGRLVTDRRPTGSTAPDASPEPRFLIEEPAQALADALRSIARLTGASLIIDARAVDGLMSPPVCGHLSALDAIRRTLEGSARLVAVSIGGIIVVRDADTERLRVLGSP
jgi:iron complex outermembrane receptor protein